ncbi:MAG: hybrid sensor histidine kinase/response regulator [Xanthomonadaceae bacterium]|nr:hybrid sensor histidine kinase/response regulator [Xanthomonadaceae bacterium]
MAGNNDELLKKLMATFRAEADEHLKAMSSELFALERTPAGVQRAKILETVFREVHSLKGAARAVNLAPVESVCQSLENLFAALKGGRPDVSSPLFDLLHQSVDALGRLLATDAGVHQPPVAALIRRLDDASRGTPVGDIETSVAPAASGVAYTPPVAPDLAAETVRISTARLDAVMRQVEELLVPRLAAGQRVRELRETAATLAVWKKQRQRMQPTLRLIGRSLQPAGERDTSVNGPMHTGREFYRLLEYMDAEQLHMKMLGDRLLRLSRSAEYDRRMLTGMADGLLREVKQMQLLPFESLLEILPRFARELARGQGKRVELQIRGGGIEVDRRILEAMKDPLIHLLRNGIDHGIEKPSVREARRKPPHGTITLAVSHQDSGKVEILVADDGAGIDAARVTAAAGELGVVSAEEAQRLDEAEALALVFRSGVSTSPLISDVSGRGLGLAIVREKVERLGGSIAIESQPGAGTAFRIVLPLTLANFRGVLVRAGGQLFVIPAANVEWTMRVAGPDIRTVENRETVAFDGQAVSLAWLGDALALPRPRTAEQPADSAMVLVLGLGSTRIAFRVDEILGEQAVLVKPLGRPLAHVRNVAGASVLGTGQVVPVLSVPDLLQVACRQSASQNAAAARQWPAGQPAAAERQSILVVEDSITSRSLLKSILESAGYRVTTAVDGADGYATLKTGTFDLIVCDVEMPRMDGFELTAKVRADKQLSELPVVLVTALGSREHRERGIDVGANAYIVKSSFDQSNLLETVGRLI